MSISQMIEKYDKSNQFIVLKDSFKQIEFAWGIKFNLTSIDISKINNIIVTGLGGSAIGGELLQNYLRKELKIPYTVNRNYELPLYANEKTLVIASSYSGNTEETISALKQAIEKKCQVICITTGGKVEELANQNNFPIGRLQKGFQPRYALWVNFFTLLNVFNSLKLIPDQTQTVEKTIELLKSKGEEYSNEQNEALALAEKMVGYVPLIYSVSDYTSAVGTRLKGQFNENSKQHAFFNNYPELDHNEIMGWEGYKPNQMNLVLLNILDDDYNEQVKKRFEITSEIIRKSGAEVINLKSNQNDTKLRLADLIYLGDWITYYYAVIRSFDPTTIDNINYLKEHL